MTKLEWERIAESTFRLRVFGGWLVEVIEFGEVNNFPALTFVPDAEHLWTIEQEKGEENG